MDPEAAKIVFNAGLPLTMVPLAAVVQSGHVPLTHCAGATGGYSHGFGYAARAGRDSWHGGASQTTHAHTALCAAGILSVLVFMFAGKHT